MRVGTLLDAELLQVVRSAVASGRRLASQPRQVALDTALALRPIRLAGPSEAAEFPAIEVVACHTLVQFLYRLNSVGLDAVVFDPTLVPGLVNPEDADSSELRRLLRRIDRPKVLFVRLTAIALRAVHSVAKEGGTELVVAGVGSTGDLLNALGLEQCYDHLARAFETMSVRIDLLPRHIAASVHDALRTMQTCSVKRIAYVAGVTPRTIELSFARVGLPQPKVVLALAKRFAGEISR